MRERIQTWDILRGVAFLSVVLQHSLANYVYTQNATIQQSYILAVWYHLAKFGVPMFIFLTGAALFYNYNKQVNFWKYIFKRIKEIFIPYLAWTMIYYFYFTHNYNFDAIFFTRVSHELIAPQLGLHLWFIVLIFQFYLLYPLLQAFWNRVNEKNNIFHVMIFCSIIYMFFMWVSYYYIPAHVQSYSPFIQNLAANRNMIFIFYFIYFLFGGAFALNMPLWLKNINNRWILLASIFIIGFSWTGYELYTGSGLNLPINLNYSTTLKPSMFILVISEIGILYLLADKISAAQNILVKTMNFIGKYSFGAYLAHALVMNYFNLKFNNILLGYTSSNVLACTFVFFIFVSAVSVILTYLASKVPLSSIVIGNISGRRHKNKKQSFNIDARM